MPSRILSSNYGKSRVRLIKIERDAEQHQMRDLSVYIRFEGDYDACYRTGDNSSILPTDTMKNTVYALAADGPLGAIEEFGKRLGAHFLKHNALLATATIEISEAVWMRMDAHSFREGGNERRTTLVRMEGNHAAVRSGIADLVILKTSGSAFAGFVRDSYTTLKETTDRIFATSLRAEWQYTSLDLDYDVAWMDARQLLLKTFAAHQSLSVQHTLYAMGDAVLQGREAIGEIRLSMPNKHCIPVDAERFGRVDRNEVFVPIDEPHGLIEAVLTRA